MIRFFWRTLLKNSLPIVLTISLAACESVKLKDGQKLYNDGKYEEALSQYHQLLAKAPDSPILNYHVALALYKKGDYGEAIEHLTKVLTTENSNLEARANYNIGNCKYRQGEEQHEKDLEGTADLYQEALHYYKRAAELDEKDEDAKFNQEFVEKKLRDILRKPQKQMAGAQKDLDKEKKDREHPLPKESFSSSEPLSTKGPADLSRIQHDQFQKAERKATEPLREGRPTKGKTIEMSREEAEKLLEAYRQEEESGIVSKDRKRRGYDPEIKKDW